MTAIIKSCLLVIGEVSDFPLIKWQVIVKAQCNFNNDKKGFALLYAWVIRNIKLDIPSIFLMEATGIYYEQLAWFLHDKGGIVSVVLPNKAKKYKDA